MIAAAVALALAHLPGAFAQGQGPAQGPAQGPVQGPACAIDASALRCELCHEVTADGRVARACREDERGSMADRSRVIVRGVPPNTEASSNDALPVSSVPSPSPRVPVPFRITVDGEVVDQSVPPSARGDSGTD